jgi:hypothetical protein
MSRLRIGVAAALLLALAAPVATTAAPKKEAALAPGAIAEKDRTRGMAEAPALAQAGGLACQVTDARFVITDVKAKINYYEVACDQGLGYIVVADPAKPAPTLATCYEANKAAGPKGQPSPLACKLPANLDLQAQLPVYVAKARSGCVIEKSRYIGASPTKTFIELACQGGTGFIMITGAPANLSVDVEMSNCLNYEAGGTVGCELTDRATQLAVVDTLVASSGKACTVKDKRYVLTTRTGSNWYEAACDNGAGYMIEQASTGGLARALACADADFVGGGCTLTDSRAAKTEQNGLYSRLAGNAGFKCNVEQYGVFSVPAKEVVELKCTDRPDGAIAEFKGSTGVIYNCALADAQGYRCSFTKKDLAYAQITRDLKSLKETTCVVGDTRAMDKATDTTVYLEAGCSDGQGSYVIGYQRGGTKPVEVLACAQSKSLGGCKLAGNN